LFLLRFLLSLPNNVWRLIVFAPFLTKSPKQRLETYCFCSVSCYYYYYYYSPFFLSFFGTWTCPLQISGSTRQNFMKLGGVIDTVKPPLYCPSIHRQTRVLPRISAVPFSVCSNNPVKMPNSHTAIRHGNWRSNGQFTVI
jgi:hypothetical protein